MKIKVTVTATMDVPDDWQIVWHGDEFQVLKIGERLCDFGLKCLTTDPGAADTWVQDDEFEEQVLERCVSRPTSVIQVLG